MDDPTRRTYRRAIPRHEPSLLSDCAVADLELIAVAIGKAIEVGAPLYNDGHGEACFRIYQGAALDLVRKLAGCVGAKQALLDGVARAEALDDGNAQAWAMRDAFDGLLDAIQQRLAASPLRAAPRRAVPEHGVDLLRGCSPQQLRLIQDTLGEAISLGVPLYNRGDAESCHRLYQAAALELGRKLQGCPGPVQALEEGLRKAAGLQTPKDKAWALRDAFDGLFLAIRRSLAN